MMPDNPALRALRLDEFQRDAAFTDETAVVSAGAGAGKTRTLVGRYLYILLEKGVGPERVLALTFTRKAAAEMFQRIHQTLVSADIARQDLAARLSNSHIQTLDSFCREIVAQSASRYGYTPDFSIDETGCNRAAEKAAYRFVLANQQAPGLRELLAAFGYEAVVHDLFASFGAAQVAPNWLGRHICRESARLGEMEFERTARAIAREIEDITARILSLAEEGRKPDSKGSSGFKEGIKQTIRAASAFQPHLPALESLRGFMAHVQMPENAINLRSVGKSDVEQSIKELAKKLRDDKLQKKISQLLDFERFLPEYREVMERLDEYSDMLCADKRRGNIMNYRDLGALAVDVLEQDEDIRHYWQNRFDYILIDEFQDNNDLQKRLLLLLSGNADSEGGLTPGSARGKLFFVGDEKQSIYLFRGADVSVFKSLAPELGASSFSLRRNYRSAQKLIAFFNAGFPFVMAPSEIHGGAQHRPFEASYEPMEFGGGEFSSHIEYHCVTSDIAPLEHEENEPQGALLGSKESMAFRTALWIKQAVESSSPYFVRDKDQQPRPARYDDIAVLMRTMSRQYELEKYLRMFAIPYSTDISTSMFTEEPLNDLYFALRLILDPEDLFATAAVLRSPLCGISNDGYATLLSERMSLRRIEEGIPESISSDISDEDRTSIDRMVALYRDLEREVDHLPLMELCDKVWRKGGIEESVRSTLAKAPYLEHWNALRAIAADIESRGGQLQAFLYEMREYMSKERTFESNAVPKQESQGLHLMTIHKAKGLEFPIVVIPWMEASANQQETSDLWGVLESEDEMGTPRRFFTADIGFHDRIESGANVLQTQARELRLEKERAETKRLLYVACTRAIDHLIMFDAAPGARAYSADSFHALLLRSTERWNQPPASADVDAYPHLGMIDFHFHPLAREGEIVAHRRSMQRAHGARAEEPSEPGKSIVPVAADSCEPPARAHAVVQPYFRLTATAFNAAANKEGNAWKTQEDLAKGIIREHIFEPSPSLLPDQSKEAATDFGTLVHELFAHLASGKSPDVFRASQETAASLSSDAQNKANALLEPLLKSPWYRSRLDRRTGHCGLKLEFPFLLRLAPWIIEGRMDVLADRGDELVVLDLKTDQRYAPYEYAIQLGLYSIAAQRLFPGKKIRAGLLYLLFGDIAWLERAPDEAALLRIGDSISYNHTQH